MAAKAKHATGRDGTGRAGEVKEAVLVAVFVTAIAAGGAATFLCGMALGWYLRGTP